MSDTSINLVRSIDDQMYYVYGVPGPSLLIDDSYVFISIAFRDNDRKDKGESGGDNSPVAATELMLRDDHGQQQANLPPQAADRGMVRSV